MACESTNTLIEMAENGLVSWEAIARECLQYMSEDDVTDMANVTGWLEDDEDE